MFTVETEKGKEPIIDGGPFRDGEYEFEQLHFHWGNTLDIDSVVDIELNWK